MRNRFLITLTASLTMAAASLGSNAMAAPSVPQSANGPHGCALSDANGNSPPVVHDSDTSHIGGNQCTYTQVATDDGTGTQGGSYFAAAQSWSVSACTPTVVNGVAACNADGSWSSAAGSPPTGIHAIAVGDQVTVSVSNGAIIVGTPNGAPGS